ncbi:MAG: hypothetical protein JNM55_15005 [Anaerolineales bacterium]|nr:hypothetical protein [Anaerolineales bacterium]
MTKIHKTIASLISTCVILGCSLMNGKGPEPFTISENKVQLTTPGLSFTLPASKWVMRPSDYKSQTNIELVSFTRAEPILLADEQAYYPTISIITETLPEVATLESYDEYVRASIENSGMTFEILDPLASIEGLMPKINGIGWKTLTHTQQGTSMGYLINIVNLKFGIRFVLESTPENFTEIEPEFIEIIKSIEVEG